MKIIILLLALCASVVYSQELTYDQTLRFRGLLAGVDL